MEICLRAQAGKVNVNNIFCRPTPATTTVCSPVAGRPRYGRVRSGRSAGSVVPRAAHARMMSTGRPGAVGRRSSRPRPRRCRHLLRAHVGGYHPGRQAPRRAHAIPAQRSRGLWRRRRATAKRQPRSRTPRAASVRPRRPWGTRRPPVRPLASPMSSRRRRRTGASRPRPARLTCPWRHSLLTGLIMEAELSGDDELNLGHLRP